MEYKTDAIENCVVSRAGVTIVVMSQELRLETHYVLTFSSKSLFCVERKGYKLRVFIQSIAIKKKSYAKIMFLEMFMK